MAGGRLPARPVPDGIDRQVSSGAPFNVSVFRLKNVGNFIPDGSVRPAPSSL